VFNEIVTALGDDWSRISGISPRDWEKLLAAAFDMDGYDEVILTPPSADGGKDVIAIKKEGVGALKIFADMKRIKLGGEVPYTDVRALAHVVQMTPDVSKGIMATTADFPPRMLEDETIAPLLSTRLQLIPGSELQPWLNSLKKA
jgi:restriction system protein